MPTSPSSAGLGGWSRTQREEDTNHSPGMRLLTWRQGHLGGGAWKCSVLGPDVTHTQEAVGSCGLLWFVSGVPKVSCPLVFFPRVAEVQQWGSGK